jgi:hypothetical protein
MYDTFNLFMPNYNAALADARELSYRFGTLAVQYSAEDTSSATGYSLFECGELIEYAENACGDGTFASKRRPLPWTSFPPAFPDDVFRTLGLYLPGFYAAAAGVRVGVPEPAAFARADLLALPRPLRAVPRGKADGFDTEFAEIHELSDEPPSDWEEGDWDEGEIPF